MIKLKTVLPNPNNPRTVNDDKFKKLVQSIKDFPKMLELRPIVVDENNIALGGNMRLKALKKLGYTEIPNNWIKRASELTDDEKRQFIIKDNVGFGDWEWDLLRADWDIDELGDWGLDLPELEEDEHIEAVEDDYSEPDNMQVDVVLGDLIEIGAHRLLCGDSTDSDAVARLMDGEKADMVFTDPPYNASFNGRSGKFEVIENDNLSELDFDNFIQAVFDTLEIFKASEMYVCCDWRMYIKVGGKFDHNQLIVWNKDIPCMGKGYRNKHEFIMYSGNLQSTTETNVWDAVAIQSGASKDDSGKGWFQGGNVQLRIHPTQKPVSIPSKAINNSSVKSMLVLDLFLGSGSTMVAAHQLKRICYGMELDPKYCQVIIDRMLKLDSSLVVKINGEVYEPAKVKST